MDKDGLCAASHFRINKERYLVARRPRPRSAGPFALRLTFFFPLQLAEMSTRGNSTKNLWGQQPLGRTDLALKVRVGTSVAPACTSCVPTAHPYFFTLSSALPSAPQAQTPARQAWLHPPLDQMNRKLCLTLGDCRPLGSRAAAEHLSRCSAAGWGWRTGPDRSRHGPKSPVKGS